MRYGYIAFEGLIGAGKTTLTRRVAEDLNGRLVRNISRRNLAATKQSIPVDTQELRSGTYLVELVSGGQRRSARLVVTH